MKQNGIFIFMALLIFCSCGGALDSAFEARNNVLSVPCDISAIKIEFTDTDWREDILKGDLTVTGAFNTQYITEYRIYWGDEEGNVLPGESPILTWQPDAGGEKTYSMSQAVTVPSGAARMVLVPSREDGAVDAKVVFDFDDKVMKLFKDIYPGGNSEPNNLIAINGKLCFNAKTSDSGGSYNFLCSDGTSENTVVIKEITASDVSEKGIINGVLYFRGNDGTNGEELWRSDGTAGGTYMVSDINSSGDSTPQYFSSLNGIIYFLAADDGLDFDLWRSDGTSGGTYKVKDITSNLTTQGLVAYNNRIYFNAEGTTEGVELFESDGTDAGTKLAVDINTGSTGSWPSDFIVYNGFMYFSAYRDTIDYELFKSDGTSGGTSLVKDINASGGSYPNSFTVYNNLLYFKANDGVHDMELWVTDGTTEDTKMVKDINISGDSYPMNFTVSMDSIFFTAMDSEKSKLWMSDGTAAGTVSLSLEGDPTAAPDPSNLAVYNDRLYFSRVHDDYGRELWVLYIK